MITLTCISGFFSPVSSDPVINEAANGNINALSKLLDDGRSTDMRSTFRGWTALHAAVYYGQLDCVKMLLSRGANTAIRDELGGTPLVRATLKYDKGGHPVGSQSRRNQCLLFLLKYGANPNVKEHGGYTALYGCILDRNIEGAKLLIENGANPHEKNDNGKSVEDIAREMGLKEFVEIFGTTPRKSSTQPRAAGRAYSTDLCQGDAPSHMSADSCRQQVPPTCGTG